MNARNHQAVSSENQRTGGIAEACARYGLGANMMRQVAKDAGAEIHIGKRYLINFVIVDRYMDSISA